MPKHKETGINGENIAENFLINNGYTILHRNWRHSKKEVDIIAQKDGLVVFAEVKTRATFNMGFPEESVTLKKRNYLRLAAAAYMDASTAKINIRFDIVSILLAGSVVKEIRHFEDAFY